MALNKHYRVEREGNSPSGRYVVVDDETKRLNVGVPIENVGKSYKEYVALISQSGTNDPTAIELVNELGVTVDYGRGGPGMYTASLSDAVLTENKTVIIMQQPTLVSGSDELTTGITILGDDEFDFNTFKNGTLSDDALTNTSLLIRVYE